MDSSCGMKMKIWLKCQHADVSSGHDQGGTQFHPFHPGPQLVAHALMRSSQAMLLAATLYILAFPKGMSTIRGGHLTVPLRLSVLSLEKRTIVISFPLLNNNNACRLPTNTGR